VRTIHKKNGEVVAEIIGESANLFLGFEEATWDFLYEPDGRPLRVGDEGCLVERTDNKNNLLSVALWDMPDGIPGNLNPAICKLWGSRGVDCDISRDAYGWRRVLSITPRKRGSGMRILFSRARDVNDG